LPRLVRQNEPVGARRKVDRKTPEHRVARASLDELAAAYRDVQLATLVEQVPQGGDWSYELKYDGYRILALKSGRDVRLMSRRQQDWTTVFAPIAARVAELGVTSCVLDGEVCALDERGRPSFQLLQNRGRGARLVYFVFDVLHDPADVRGLPLEERRTRLARILAARKASSSIIVSSSTVGDGVAVLRAACAEGLEGVVAKQRGSTYAPGRSRSWLKIKCLLRQEFAVVGWLPLEKTQAAVGSLLLAVFGTDHAFHFAGKVGTGFDDKTRRSLFHLLERDATERPTAEGVPRSGGLVRFVEPKLVVEVAFGEWTEGGHVRHPSFQGVREDKRPEDCVREAARAPEDLGP
jgi:bifunctional non-homologous end joining protein LigD